MSGSGQWIMGGLTHPGRVRPENEDCIAMRADLGLAVLADGMGGHQAGEVASRMAIDIITAHFAEPGSARASDEQEALAQAIRKANAAIHDAAQTRSDYKGMGSTVVAVRFEGNRMYVGHVGDSRLYRFRGGRLEQVTKDHSVVQELVNRGLFTAEEARQSIAKNLVTRALGVDATIEADTAAATTEKSDLYLLCSDGLTDVLDDAEIASILGTAESSIDATMQRLVERANEQGGPDNVSVILAQFKRNA